MAAQMAAQVAVADTRGRVGVYTVSGVVVAPGLFRCVLTSAAGRSYRVERDGATWRCQCKARAFGHGKLCKHLRFAENVVNVLEAAGVMAAKDNSAEGQDVQAVTRALAAPFDANEVKFKPAVVQGNRALALPYVDARVIQDRLDNVMGVSGWQDEYESLPDGSVVCRLRLKLGGEWITKMDVGGMSEQPDEGDRHKAAFSDALKRAAVKFGVGRYLYRLAPLWCDFDPHKKQFIRKPELGTTTRTPAPVKAAPPAQQQTAPPANGKELDERLAAFDRWGVEHGRWRAGEAVAYVRKEAQDDGEDAPVQEWTGYRLGWAMDKAKEFAAGRRGAKQQKAG